MFGRDKDANIVLGNKMCKARKERLTKLEKIR